MIHQSCIRARIAVCCCAAKRQSTAMRSSLFSEASFWERISSHKRTMLCSFLLVWASNSCATMSNALVLPSCSVSFLGQAVTERVPAYYSTKTALLTMRKQKASDRRTRRRQRGYELEQQQVAGTTTFTVSPMQGATWKHKHQQHQQAENAVSQVAVKAGGGRGRSRKRTALYQTLAHYHNHFLQQLTAEYQAEVSLHYFRGSFFFLFLCIEWLLKLSLILSGHTIGGRSARSH